VAKILIVDDSHDFCKLMERILAEGDYQLVQAYDGPQGLEVAEAEMPDLILLDYMMPGMNGFDVFEALRAKEETCRIPVVMITAFTGGDFQGDRLKAITLGMDDYLSKPISPHGLRQTIAAILLRHEKRRLAEADPASPSAAPPGELLFSAQDDPPHAAPSEESYAHADEPSPLDAPPDESPSPAPDTPPTDRSVCWARRTSDASASANAALKLALLVCGAATVPLLRPQQQIRRDARDHRAVDAKKAISGSASYRRTVLRSGQAGRMDPAVAGTRP
jgi:CheY-like chemotaxis protein